MTIAEATEEILKYRAKGMRRKCWVPGMYIMYWRDSGRFSGNKHIYMFRAPDLVATDWEPVDRHETMFQLLAQ